MIAATPTGVAEREELLVGHLARDGLAVEAPALAEEEVAGVDDLLDLAERLGVGLADLARDQAGERLLVVLDQAPDLLDRAAADRRGHGGPLALGGAGGRGRRRRRSGRRRAGPRRRPRRCRAGLVEVAAAGRVGRGAAVDDRGDGRRGGAVVVMELTRSARVASPVVHPARSIVIGAGNVRRLARAALRPRRLGRHAGRPVEPGHMRAGSGGESRLIRCSHGADAWHTRLRAPGLASCGRDRACAPRGVGVAWFARRAARLGVGQRAHAARLRIPVERWTSARRAALPEPEHRRPALRPLGAGGRVLRGRVATRRWRTRRSRRAPSSCSREARARRRARRRSTTGARLEADVSCGPAARGSAGSSAISSPADHPPGPLPLRRRRRPGRCRRRPAGSTTTGPPTASATSTGGRQGRLRRRGPASHPERARWSRRPRHEPPRAHTSPPLPGARAARPRRPARAAYAADRRHALHRRAASRARRRVWLLGGGSGHGFKHGPAIAEYVGEMLAGDAPARPALRARRARRRRQPAHGRLGGAAGSRASGASARRGGAARSRARAACGRGRGARSSSGGSPSRACRASRRARARGRTDRRRTRCPRRAARRGSRRRPRRRAGRPPAGGRRRAGRGAAGRARRPSFARRMRMVVSCVAVMAWLLGRLSCA